MTQIQQIKHRQSMDYWKQVILAQQQSGLKAREYCRQQDIKYNAFYYWLRKIREEIVEGMPQLKAETAD
ncbi:IS66 family insertion sequence element accessory protein TnpA, partial [Selenomonas sp. KH1T6]|uniref:IS66 family insertion sequence element accessory protein TnpA n=3 Tax=Selenomonas sp. KH1T6 TaxID=3158784 RepID=UPI0008A7FE78